MDEKKEMTIEESFAALDDMVKKLESDKISLEESFRLHEEAMKLEKHMSGRIEHVKKKMQIIAGNGETEDFE